mgnify:CR=1 FL=1
MSENLFFTVLVAVVAANMLTVAALFGFYQINKAEKSEEDRQDKTVHYLLIIIPLLIVAVGTYVIF